ncbi:MAG: DUF559 domain-containing protein, partial [Proteobacteria bacterium]|nr:DUF559 domain-containing protein [Pseudomonadota bacterium]
MKKHSEKEGNTNKALTLEGEGNTNKALPLEGGGKRVGVKESRGIARALRKRSTDTESYLWRYLKNRQMEGFKFR